MGKYLGIGIVTEVHVDKDEAVKALYTEDAAVKFLNERYNPTGLYNFTFNEKSGNYVFALKRDIMHHPSRLRSPHHGSCRYSLSQHRRKDNHGVLQ